MKDEDFLKGPFLNSAIRSKDNRNTEDQENYLQASVDALRRRLRRLNDAERLLCQIGCNELSFADMHIAIKKYFQRSEGK